MRRGLVALAGFLADPPVTWRYWILVAAIVSGLSLIGVQLWALVLLYGARS